MSPLLSTDAAKQHYAWRRKLNAHAPRVMARIFALRGKMYYGAGVHYAMEKRAGSLLARLNDYATPLAFADTIIEEIAAEALMRDLVLAERSAREWDRRQS